ncbi:MAG: IgGFc-binding protein, partial [Prevotellaceae bacterium]|nr:IgGFc-binding protein [Candidatus Colivivens equi]
MYRRLLSILLFMLISANLWADGASWWNTDYNTTEGTDFWVTFMRNAGKGKHDIDIFLRLFASARQDTKVTIYFNADTLASTWNPTDSKVFYVKANNQYGLSNEEAIPNMMAYIEDADDKYKGIYIHSDNPISLYALNYFKDSYDATLVLPTSALGREYVIQTYKQDRSATEFVIVATEDGTKLVVTPMENGAQEAELQVSLDKGNTYIYRSSSTNIDLSGTVVCSNLPIAVFHGNQDAYIPTGNSNGPPNHLYEQDMPVEGLGKTFVVTRTANQDRDVVRVTAVEDGTQISINGVVQKTLQSLETAEFNIKWSDYAENAFTLQASRAVYCGLYLTSFSVNASTHIGAPTYTSIVPLETAINSTIVSIFPFRAEMQQRHYINIVVPTEAVSEMYVDNKNVSAEFQPLSSPINGVYYSAARIKVDTTAHVLTNEKGKFVAHIYGIGHEEEDDGNAWNESYAYSVASNITPTMWMLIDGERVDSVKICEDNGPLTFTSIINFDYTDVRWEFHHLQGTTTTIVIPKTISATGDSVVSKKYDDIPRNLPIIPNHIDTVMMIVTRKTPLCEFEFIDTVKAVVQVNDTFLIDENKELKLNENVCYGDSFYLHLNGTILPFIADTITEQSFNGETFIFELNKEYSFLDSLTTQFGCDSIILQKRILRPTFDTTIRDTLCYQSLPYQWRDGSGRKVYTLTTEDLVQKSNLHLTEENVFLVDSIIKDTTLTTQYGCDSTVHITWLVLPDYNIPVHKDVCADTIDTHYKEWSGHISEETGEVLPEHHLQILQNNGVWKDVKYIDISTFGTFTYRDVLKTTAYRCKQCEDKAGCDSIWTLTLNVIEHEIVLSKHTMCDDESYLWEDTLRLGPKCPAPPEGTIFKRYDKSVMIDVQHPTTKALDCDSTYRLLLTINPSYQVSKLDTICDTELPYEWRLSDSQGTSKTITFNPSKKSEDLVIDSVDTLQTIYGCD